MNRRTLETVYTAADHYARGDWQAAYDTWSRTGPDGLSAAELDCYGAVVELVGVAPLDRGDALLGEPVHRIGTDGVTEEAQRLTGEVVVVADQGAVAVAGEHPGPGRPAAPARAGGPAGLDEALRVQRVDLATHGGLGETQPLHEGGDADRPLLAHDTQDPVARARLQDRHLGINHTPMLGNCSGPVQGRPP